MSRALDDRRRGLGFCLFVRPVPDGLAGGSHEVWSEAAPNQPGSDRIKQLLVACRSSAGSQPPRKIDGHSELGFWAEVCQGLVHQAAIHASRGQLGRQGERTAGAGSSANMPFRELPVVLEPHLGEAGDRGRHLRLGVPAAGELPPELRARVSTPCHEAHGGVES